MLQEQPQDIIPAAIQPRTGHQLVKADVILPQQEQLREEEVQ